MEGDKNVKTKATLVAQCCLVYFLVGCGMTVSQGPSDSQVRQDIDSGMDQRCMKSLREGHRPYAVIDAVKIAGTKIENNEATVLVGVEYHWVTTPTMMESFGGPPCTYFNGSHIKDMAQPTLTYRKYGSDWKLVAIK